MRKLLLILLATANLVACTKEELTHQSEDNSLNTLSGRQPSIEFSASGSIDLGGEGAAEISAYDPMTKKLFVVNNSSGFNRIDVVDIANPNAPVILSSIPVSPFGGLVNSVAVSNGKLAAAIEATNKTSAGKLIVFATDNLSVIAERTVGALPDMVCFSPDGKLILTANEGEPNDAYTVDPEGTVSIVDVSNNYSVLTLNFASFAPRLAELKTKGLRIFGKNASFAQDIEPEYIAVAQNSKKAWVTLQENNAIAVIDLETKTIVDILPLGFKNYNTAANAIDVSDNDGGVFFNAWNIKGVYMPDGIAVLPNNNVPLVFTANEGDAREYSGYSEIRRINHASVLLDPTAFPNPLQIKNNAVLGRLNITTSLGDSDGDGDFDELYSFGGRSFSIWDGETGAQVFDSKNELDKKTFEYLPGSLYPDNRSDDKGAEPEGITTGRVGNKNLLFVGLERANAVMIYELTNPQRPEFRQWLSVGVAPEGVLFVDAANSPTGKSLLIVSSETDGLVKIFTVN
jgi:DNA-binding beta-propeller fold protein YncE